jgi:hypothetical protein
MAQRSVDWTTVVADARKLREQSKVLRDKVKATVDLSRLIVEESRTRQVVLEPGRGWRPRPVQPRSSDREAGTPTGLRGELKG